MCKQRHPHADVIIAYANDESLKIEYSHDGRTWSEVTNPSWNRGGCYRIKPKPMVKVYLVVYKEKHPNSAIKVTTHCYRSVDQFKSKNNHMAFEWAELLTPTMKEVPEE